MDPAIFKGLNHVKYDNRKNAALELEKLLRECSSPTADLKDQARIPQIIDQAHAMLSPSNSQTTRNGGLIGLAAAAIALGEDIVPYFQQIIPSVLDCFPDQDNRIRYFAVECVYNVGKVAQDELLRYFNEIFDALSKLAIDSNSVVRNGAELLDRLLKDTVSESASRYVAHYSHTTFPRSRYHRTDRKEGETKSLHGTDDDPPIFSLERFIPLLEERIYVIAPQTRNHLVSWITVLDSVPELELVSYLPSFLDGLLKYLADENIDVRVATENVLADFLREIREIAKVKKQQTLERATRQLAASQATRKPKRSESKSEANDLENQDAYEAHEEEEALNEADSEDLEEEWEGKGSGSWIPGQGVIVQYVEIMDILLKHVSYPNEIIQETALHWLSEFLLFAQDVMTPSTSKLVPAILPNLAHPSPAIRNAAAQTNLNLFRVIQSVPAPISPDNNNENTTLLPSRRGSGHLESNTESNPQSASSSSISKPRLPVLNNGTSQSESPVSLGPADLPKSTLHSSTSQHEHQQAQNTSPSVLEEDPFDYQATVNVLTMQFLSDYEETRVAALEWLIMLHQKAPKKILAMDDGTFPVLLKCLSDPSEEVIKRDLQLLAQISSSSGDSYFTLFVVNLLDLFSTDRRLLETRGSLIIRQLCVNLNSERIYRTCAEILEKEEDLEFASSMVQKLNIILITSSELLEFRKRLKNLDSKDGQMLFSVIYRSWCHSPVAVFALCLLAQAYEHASNLLQLFADLDITVQLLVQIDKLVQLIESPVFTSLRLQLLEPEKYPHLFKCLYGLLMLLPQSTAFVSLRNRLNAVSSMGFLHIPKPAYSTTAAVPPRAKLSSPDEIKWRELIHHFRSVQARHEKARRVSSGLEDEVNAYSSWRPLEPSLGGGGAGSGDGGISSRHASVASLPAGVNAPSSSTNGAGPSTAGLRGPGSAISSATSGAGPRRKMGTSSMSSLGGTNSTGQGGLGHPNSPRAPGSETAPVSSVGTNSRGPYAAGGVGLLNSRSPGIRNSLGSTSGFGSGSGSGSGVVAETIATMGGGPGRSGPAMVKPKK